jgi:hypothetical protein
VSKTGRDAGLAGGGRDAGGETDAMQKKNSWNERALRVNMAGQVTGPGIRDLKQAHFLLTF